MWFHTRHYSGRSCEIDHLVLDTAYRGQGIGNKMMTFIYNDAIGEQGNWVEINTYVDHYSSHKFYNNQDLIARDYHFIKPLLSKQAWELAQKLILDPDSNS